MTSSAFSVTGTSNSPSSYRLISSQSASDSATINFNSLSLSSYAAIDIIVSNWKPVTNGTTFNMTLNGISSAVYNTIIQTSYQNTTGGTTGTGATAVQFANSISNISSYPNSLSLRIYNPGTSGYISFSWTIFSLNSVGPYQVLNSGSGYFAVNGPLTDIAFAMGSGNIATGDFYLYGIDNA